MRPLVIVPTYNERDNLPPLLERCWRFADCACSSSTTPRRTARDRSRTHTAAANRARVQVLHRTGQRGLGLSYIDGMYVALRTDATHICQMDADFSHNPADVPRLLARDRTGGLRHRLPIRRRRTHRELAAASTDAQRVCELLHPRHHAAARSTTARAASAAGGARPLERLPLASIRSDGYAFHVEMAWEASRARLRIAEVPITFVERREGASKLSSGVIMESAIVPWRLAARPNIDLRHMNPCPWQTSAPTRPTRAQHVLPRLQRRRNDREPRDPGGAGRGRLTPDFEVIVVNDGSTGLNQGHSRRARADVSAACASFTTDAIAATARALRTGFASATKDLIAYTDGDAQYDPAELEVLWNSLTPEADMVTGFKIRRSDPLHRIVIGRLYHHAVKLLFRLRVRDVDCDFRLMRREIFDRVKLEKDTGVICLEMMRKIQDAGFRVVEVPVHHYHRMHGRSQFFNFKRVFWTGIDVMKLWVKLVVLGRGRTNSPVLFRNPTISGVVPPESTKP